MKKERKPKSFLPKPVYPGGTRKMSQFIRENLKYPKQAAKDKLEGTVALRITINYKGTVTNVKVKSSLSNECDAEAKRIARLLKFEVDQRVRKGKILFHKNLNIGFRLPKQSSKPKSLTQVNYQITISKSKPKETSETKSQKSSSYSYVIKY